MEISKDISSRLKNESLDIRVEIEKYLRFWKWFLIGVIASMALAFVYLRYTVPNFSAKATIMIKDNKNSGISAELAAFEDLGIIGGGSANNTENEKEILKSRKIIGLVVDSLDLTIYHSILGRVIETEVYKNSNPLNFKLIKDATFSDRTDTTFFISPINEVKYSLLDADEDLIGEHNFEEIVSSEFGSFKVIKNQDFNGEKFLQPIRIKIVPRRETIDRYIKNINVVPISKTSSVINLTLKDVNAKKAEDILDELIRQYNIDGIQDKNQVSEKTKEFIDERLEKVKSELFLIDKNVKDFKSDKDFTGLSVEAQLAFESLKESNQKITEARISLSWAKEIERILKVESDKYETLPASLGFTDAGLSSSIDTYNKVILQLKKYRENAGDKNPIILDLLSQKRSLQTSLIASLENISNSLKTQLKELSKEQSIILQKVKAFPANEQGFIDISRQQEIISGLYQYLLRKKEETDISLAVAVPNAKIIDSAYSNGLPVSPRSKLIYLAALVLGLLVPFTIIYARELIDTKVHNKQGIESELSVPFLGDVPKSDSKEKVVIGNDIRSSTAEAFRLIRTNLDFMLASNRTNSKAIFVTSTTSGEGKSFISINLAATLALSGKKVLLMGMDLRAPKVTEYLGIPERKGITNYITDEDMTLESIIFSIPEIKGLDIIASGVIPPNPAELLMTKRVENLFTIVKQEYDFVLVDTAPVNLVTDTLLIGKHADMVMYVVRANYLDKRLLAVPQELYNEKKLPNMAIVLNDTDPKRSYGYGYGGYGYGYVVVEKPWYKKIFDRS